MLMFYSTKSSKGGAMISSSFRFPQPTMLTTAAAVVVVVVLMTNTINHCCDAAMLLKSNVTYDRYCLNDNCLIAEDLELEFLMDSHVSRILADTKNHEQGTGGSGDQNAPVQPCGKTKPGEQYCLLNGKKVSVQCYKYNRNHCN
ncbi:hypothetical protein CsatA_017058 [Cannabis sativa]